jgi:ribonuclease HII
LFGPVISCCVIANEKFNKLNLSKIRDSKKLSEKLRNNFVKEFIDAGCDFGLGSSNNKHIDKSNIGDATLFSMKDAINNLKIKPRAILVDGIQKIPNIDCYQLAITKGDSICKSIGAASILAKFVRDFIIRKYHNALPYYDLKSNVGYGTTIHIKNINTYGKSFGHRKSFKIKSIDR